MAEKHILLTNDDGLDAVGLRAIFEALVAQGYAVTVLAPHVQNSGVGHALTLDRPICLTQENWPGARAVYRVEGTPADCVRLGMQVLLPQRVDMVVSGINHGFNTGRYVHCSGTIAAALEGVINRGRAVAFSLDLNGGEESGDGYACAAKIGAEVVGHMFAHPSGPGEMLNVNIPNLPREKIRGYQYARLGNEAYLDRFYETEEGNGVYVAEFVRESDIDNDCDIHYLREGYVTLTPLHWDMTAHTGLHERPLPSWGKES